LPIRGFFSDTHIDLHPPVGSPADPAFTAVPYVWAFVYLPAFQRRVLVPFLLDTGADATILHPQDSLRVLGESEITGLGNATPFGGAGAGKDHYPAEALLVFMNDDGSLRQIRLTIYVAEPGTHNQRIESLLGRDALSHFLLAFDQGAKTFTLGG
jgi:hypothetical protein